MIVVLVRWMVIALITSVLVRHILVVTVLVVIMILVHIMIHILIHIRRCT